MNNNLNNPNNPNPKNLSPNDLKTSHLAEIASIVSKLTPSDKDFAVLIFNKIDAETSRCVWASNRTPEEVLAIMEAIVETHKTEQKMPAAPERIQ